MKPSEAVPATESCLSELRIWVRALLTKAESSTIKMRKGFIMLVSLDRSGQAYLRGIRIFCS